MSMNIRSRIEKLEQEIAGPAAVHVVTCRPGQEADATADYGKERIRGQDLVVIIHRLGD